MTSLQIPVYLSVSLSFLICKMPILQFAMRVRSSGAQVCLSKFASERLILPKNNIQMRDVTAFLKCPASTWRPPSHLKVLVSSHWVQGSWLWIADHEPICPDNEGNDFASIERQAPIQFAFCVEAENARESWRKWIRKVNRDIWSIYHSQKWMNEWLRRACFWCTVTLPIESPLVFLIRIATRLSGDLEMGWKEEWKYP